MPDKIKALAAEAAACMKSIPVDKRELASKVVEAFATGISVGSEIYGKEQKNESENDGT